jgi:succinate dehydrogenase / fumarate reductase flavoprotein subunit
MSFNSNIPAGEMSEKWNDYKGHVKLVNPANKRKLEVIVIGTGLPALRLRLRWVSWVIK